MEYQKICEQCGNPKKQVPAGISRKTGNSYAAFSVCETCKPRKQYQKSAQEDGDQGKMLLEGQKIINERLDKMAEFLKSKLDDK